jgi:phospholipid/cholesterol/gamma-HCH transport system substrate-binding protein
MSDARPAETTPPPPAPPVRGQGKTAWVGLFLIVGILGVLAVLFVMTDAAIFRGRYIITTHVKDAGGIRSGDPVRMRGVNIGRVKKFVISHDDVAVDLEIEGEYKIPTDSQVKLSSAGPLGGMKADVVPGVATTYVKYGDTVAGLTEQGLEDMTAQAGDVMARVQKLLADDTIANVNGSTTELRALLGELNRTVVEQRKELVALTASLRRSSGSLEKTMSAPELERSVKRLDGISTRMDEVTQTLDRGTRSLETVMARIEKGEGSLGKLTRDDALYDNMSRAALSASQATENINKLTEEIRRNPKKYLKVSVF